MGPLLFSIYINDLPETLKCLSLVYADDVTLFADVPSARKREDSLLAINEDLRAAMDWSTANQMKFSSAKSQSLLLSRKKDKHKNGPVILDGNEVKNEASLNLLGVHFSSSGTVSEHLMSKARTAGKLVSMLRRNRMFLSVKARAQVYFTCIRPIMEYACPIFVNSAGYALRALDRIDARAKRLFPTVPSDTLTHRRDVAGLCVLHSIVHGNVPSLVKSIIKPTPLPVTRTTRYNDCLNLAALKIPVSKTEAHKNSFLPYYTRLWNSLGNETVFASSSQDFKRRASRELRTTPIASAEVPVQER